MKKLTFYYDTHLRFSSPVSNHEFLLRCVPPDLPEQEIGEFFLLVRPTARGGAMGSDGFGNRIYTGRIPESHRFFRYTVRGIALRDDSKRKICEPLPAFRYKSPLTLPSWPMREFLKSLKLGDLSDFDKAARISKAIHERMSYAPGVTGVRTTAGEAFLMKKGVCQDYTHVFLALCRMEGIAARYVSGLPEGEGASHAWGEIWYGGYWHGFDPTRDVPVDEGYLKLACGRDFADCPIESGLFEGGATNQQQEVYMKVEAAGETEPEIQSGAQS